MKNEEKLKKDEIGYGIKSTAISIIFAGLLIGGTIIFIGNVESNGNTNTIINGQSSNVEIKDGVQFVTINARGGYFPRISNAKAGVPTKFIMKTRGTYDCSAYLIINSLGYKNILPSNGETLIDAGTPASSGLLRGTCGMGMYGFSVNFI